jgi:hypothetical protein
MPLFGTFDTMQLSDLAQWIAETKQSGTMIITVDADETYLAFGDGDITAVGSGGPLSMDAGQILLARRAVTEDQFAAAVAAAGHDRKAADVLVERGIVARERVEELTLDHAFTAVLDLFFHEEGSFHFSCASAGGPFALDDRPITSTLVHPISTKKLALEAMRRLDDWGRIRAVLPSNLTVVYAVEGSSTSEVWRELRDLGGPVAIGDLCLRLRKSRFAVYKELYDLHAVGLVGVDPATLEVGGAAGLGPVGVLMDNARLLVQEEQFDEAREVLSTVLSLEPENRDARDLMKRLRQAQLSYLYEQIPPHKVPVLAVSRGTLGALKLSPKENYLVSRFDGKWDVATLVVATPLGELETLRMLKKLLHAQIARLR